MKRLITIVVFLMVGSCIYAQQQPAKKVLKSEETIATEPNKEVDATSIEKAKNNNDNPPVLVKKALASSRHQGPIRKIIVPEEKESTEPK